MFTLRSTSFTSREKFEAVRVSVLITAMAVEKLNELGPRAVNCRENNYYC